MDETEERKWWLLVTVMEQARRREMPPLSPDPSHLASPGRQSCSARLSHQFVTSPTSFISLPRPPQHSEPEDDSEAECSRSLREEGERQGGGRGEGGKVEGGIGPEAQPGSGHEPLPVGSKFRGIILMLTVKHWQVFWGVRDSRALPLPVGA